MPVVIEFNLQLLNKPGSLAEACSELAAKAVNIQAIMAADVSGKAGVRLVVNHPETARKIFERLGVKFSEAEVIAAQLSDKPGALGRVTRKLAEKSININYAYGSIEKGAPQALIVLAVSDVKAAAALLK